MPKSLIIQPFTTHQQLTVEEQLAAGVTPNQPQTSVGIEHVDDIINDLKKMVFQPSKHK